MKKFIKRRIGEFNESKTASESIRRKAREAYFQEKEKQAIVYARQKAQVERERKVAKLRMRPMFYKEAYRAAGRLGRYVEPRRAFQNESHIKHPISKKDMKVMRMRKFPKRKVRRRSSPSQQNQFFDNSMAGGFDFGY